MHFLLRRETKCRCCTVAIYKTTGSDVRGPLCISWENEKCTFEKDLSITYTPNVAVQFFACLFLIWETTGSILGPETGYH
jgi:hypothetical protein